MIEIRPGDIIKHDGFRDVAIYVMHVGQLEYGATSVQVGGVWVNRGFINSWFLDENIFFSIELKDLKKWKVCVNPLTVMCLRNAEWKPIRG